MKLLHLEIVNFGKLSRYSLDLKDGLNVFCEPNGFGKSTLAAFIKAMLYGLPATRNHSLDKNERKKFSPWQGGSFGGSMDFQSELGCFRIERFFGVKESADEFRLFDLSTNKPSTVYSADVGIELFGIDADGFERSAFLSQIVSDGVKENATVTAKLTGLLEEVNDMSAYDGAIEALEKRKRFYEVKGGRGKIADLTAELTEVTTERDRCNELLPVQDAQYQELMAKQTAIQEAEAEQKKLQGLRTLVHAKKLHLEECARSEQAISEWEERRGAILSCFRDRNLPTDEEILEARRILRDFRVSQGRLETTGLSEEERRQLQQWTEQYPAGMPDAAQVAKLQAMLNRETELKAKLESISAATDTRDIARFRQTGIPETPLLDRATEQLDAAERLTHKKKALEDTPIATARKIPVVASVLFLLAGAAFLIGGFLSEAFRLPFLGAGGALALVGILSLLLGGGNARQAEAQRSRELAQLQTDIDKSSAFVRNVLQRYHAIPTNGNLREGLTDLHYAAKNASEQQRARLDRERQHQEYEKAYAQTHEKLEQEFSAMGFPTYPKDPQQLLQQMFLDAREWHRLSQKEGQLQAQINTLQDEMKDRQQVLNDFFNRLVEKESKNPEACLDRAEMLCRDHAILLGNIRQKKEELTRLRAEYQRTAPSALPEEDLLAEEEQALAQRLETLRNEEAELDRRFKRTTEITRSLPEHEDRITSLNEELKQARGRLSTLKYASQFLTESKEALSTRYLGGMQEHFTHFRKLVQGEDIPDATIDTDFAISVRAEGKSRELESFSRGTRDILQLCARLALSESMFAEGEQPFYLLDDPFVNLDEAHLKAARGLLDRLAEDRQILYFVCHPNRS